MDYDAELPERRLKVMWIDVAQVFRLYVNMPQYVNIPIFKGLPDRVEIRAVKYDPARDQFCFVLHHPSFAKVPTGCYPPSIDVNFAVWKSPQPEEQTT